MRTSSPVPHPKRMLVLAGVALVGAVALLQFAGSILLDEGFVTIFVRERLASAHDRVADPPAALPPPVVVDRTRAFAVMIDNHPNALPQSGLIQADEIWEAPVEGGLTRLMAVYRSQPAGEIGPVRSARPYFLDWARQSDAVYVHVGGSDEALEILHVGALALDDANEFQNGTSFWRDRARLAPHNTYTSTEKMRALIAKKGWRELGDAADASIRSDIAPAGAPAPAITLTHIAGGLETTYAWNAERQAFGRTVRGTPTATRAGEPVEPTTVVVIETDWLKTPDPHGKGLIGLRTAGEGRAIVLRDGIAAEGTWKKPGADAPLEVFGKDGRKLPFREGLLWYDVIATNKGGSVSWR